MIKFYKILRLLLMPIVNIVASIKFNILNKNLYKGIYLFFYDLNKYSKLNKNKIFDIKYQFLKPMVIDRFSNAGNYDPHYFYQDIWAAKKVFSSKVSNHYDIGSKLSGFIAHCLIFTKVTMIDIRPLKIKVENLEFLQSDATYLNEIEDESIYSISSLHAIEHFGLGRYGDPVNPNAYYEVIKSIQRVVAKEGNIYISVPIGIERVEFHAHRVFNPNTIIKLFDRCELVEFSVIDDNGCFISFANPDDYISSSYTCGCYHFRKK